MKVVLAHSLDIDSADAVEEVVRDCRDDLGALVPQAGILIASIEHDFDVLQQRILAEWPGLELIGCTGDGEISTVGGSAEDSVALMLFHSERVRFRVGLGRGVSQDPAEAARTAVEQAMADESEKPSLAIILPEGWGININDLLAGFQQELGQETLLVGGMASEPEHTGLTRQAFKGETISDGVPCMLFFGPLLLSCAVRSGMKPVGRRDHVVTQADGPLVRTIDDKPAADLWDHYFGGHSIFNPLAVFPEDDGEYFIAATPESYDDGSAYFFNPIPVGSVVRPADATLDETLEATGECTKMAVQAYPGSRPDGAVVFSCAGRRAYLGTKKEVEVDLLKAALPEGVPAIGFYSNGELCPLKGQTTTRDHGFTFVTVLLGES